MIIIRQILHKSLPLIIFFLSVAALLSLSSASLFYWKDQIQNNKDFLGDDAVQINIKCPIGAKEEYPDFDSVISQLNEEKVDYLLYKDFSIAGCKGVYFSKNSRFNPEIVEGRNFDDTDFTQRSKTIIINESMISKCTEGNGKKYFYFENEKYEVIGVFRNNLNNYNFALVRAADCFINMTALADSQKSAFFMGTFYLDAGKHTPELYEKLENLIMEFEDYSIKKNPVGESGLSILKSVLQFRWPIFCSLIIATLLLSLNIYSATTYWIEGRRKEISIRRLTGATIYKVKILFLRDYVLLTTAGYLAGLIFSIIIMKFRLIPYFGDSTLEARSLIVSFVLSQLLGVFFAIFTLHKYFRHEIARNLR